MLPDHQSVRSIVDTRQEVIHALPCAQEEIKCVVTCLEDSPRSHMRLEGGPTRCHGLEGVQRAGTRQEVTDTHAHTLVCAREVLHVPVVRQPCHPRDTRAPRQQLCPRVIKSMLSQHHAVPRQIAMLVGIFPLVNYSFSP